MALKAGFATLSAFPLVPAPCQNGPPERESTYVSSIPPGKGKYLRFKHPPGKGKTPEGNQPSVSS